MPDSQRKLEGTNVSDKKKWLRMVIIRAVTLKVAKELHVVLMQARCGKAGRKWKHQQAISDYYSFLTGIQGLWFHH